MLPVNEETVLSKPVASFDLGEPPKATLKSKFILAIWTVLFSFLVGLILMQEQPKVGGLKSTFFPSGRDTLIVPDSSSCLKPRTAMEVYLQAYPDFITGIDRDSLIWRDGTKMRFDDGITDKSFESLLEVPDLEDQLRQQYPLGSKYVIQNSHDPGRIRYEPFFKKMYGANPEQVMQHLVTIHWLPKSLNIVLKVTKINGIDKKLQQISNELDKLPHLRKYLENPGGTFNWRKIAGTKRLSTHSFGATIDINVQYSHYWKWDFDKYGRFTYKNLIPLEIVEIFEKYGFVWGGKWYHYDTMHFEYRPELILTGKKGENPFGERF